MSTVMKGEIDDGDPLPDHEAVLHWLDGNAESVGAGRDGEPENPSSLPGWTDDQNGRMSLRRTAANWHGLTRPQTKEGAAAWIVQSLRAMQAEGPYWLAAEACHASLLHAVGLQLLGQDQQIAFLGLLGAVPLAPEVKGALHCGRALPGWSLEPMSGRIVRLDLQASGAVPRTVTVARSFDGGPESLQALWSDALNLGDSEALQRPPELDYQPLIKLQTGHAAHAPLFCVPGAGDSVMGLRDWATALGAEWPVYGVQPRGTDGVLLPHSTVEAAAAMALRAIESIAGAGPVHLAGHSFGGWVAFEIAQRWRALGREVLSLTLLDSEAPDAAGVLDKEHSHLDVCEQLASSLELASGRPLGLFRHQLAPLSPAQRLAAVHAAMTRHGLLPARTRPEVMEGPLQAFASALRASYRPARVWESRVHLIQADDPRRSAARNAQDQQHEYERWLLWAPRLQRWKGPGNHMSMLRPPQVRLCVNWYLAQDHGVGLPAMATAPQVTTKQKGVKE